MLPFEACMAEIERWADNLDMILPVKAKLFNVYVNGPLEEVIALCDEWPSTFTMIGELHTKLYLKYEDYELVNMVFEAVAEKYMNELEGMMQHD